MVIRSRLAVKRSVGVDEVFQRPKAGDTCCLDAGTHGLRVGVQLHQFRHDLACAFVARLQFQAGPRLAVAVGVARRDQAADGLPLGFTLEHMLQGTEQQKEGGQTLLTIDHLVVILLIGRRYQHSANEVFPSRAGIDLLVDVLKELMHLLVGPDVFALVVGDPNGKIPLSSG